MSLAEYYFSDFECMECGRKFRSIKSAEKASMDGCPKCGGVDIDLAPDVDIPLAWYEAEVLSWANREVRPYFDHESNGEVSS